MQLLIKGYSFQLSAPYNEGHSLTSGEASALNDLRKENIQNNFRSQVADQTSNLALGELLPQNILDGLQAKLTEYDQTYKFAEKSGRNRLSDIDLEIGIVAAERARAQAEDPAQLPGLIAEFIGLPAVREEARSRVAARRSALAGGMDSL